MSEGIQTIVMPKWGLAMQEGMVAEWHVQPGAAIEAGDEIADIETSKIANVFESPIEGKLRRIVADAGETVPVGALIAVVADDAVDDGAIDGFIEEFQANFVVEDAAAGGPEPEVVETDTGRIRYLKLGDAEATPVLFIHGFGGDLNNWMFNQEALAETSTTYAIDLPGHGGSTKDPHTGDVGAMTQAVLAFMGALGLEKSHFVGHSMGGAVCLDMALNHPEKVASATLVAPASLGPDINMSYIDGFMREKRAKKLKPVLEMLVHDPKMISAEMVDDVIKYKRVDGVDAALNTIANATFAGGHQSLELKNKLDEISLPMQIIWGEQDQILPFAHADGVSDTVKVHSFADAGHMPHMEKAAEVNALILEFVHR
ncbi:MAG: acetoin dehydrogenase dihydrolipoyllysine-residue acetyltransferase subunit [Geminicoccaceae bacterium]